MKELSLNILDIAKNSVTANATLIAIEITEITSAATLTIQISDDGCGMSKETLERVTNPFYTTRTTRKVGLGIPFFKMEAEMTGGTFAMDSTLGKGTTVRATFYTNHMDFIPLGDIISTMLTLIGGSPTIDFTLTHQYNDKLFVFSTQEVRTALGEEIPLDEPEVILWMKDYLKELYDSLQENPSDESL